MNTGIRIRRPFEPHLLLAGAMFGVAALVAFPGAGRPAGAVNIDSGVDAILLEENLDIDILSDSLARVRYFNRTKVLTGRGVEQHKEAGISYTPSETIRGFHAALTTPDGKRKEMKKADFYGGASFESFELYADTKFRAVRFSGIVPGSTLEFGYEIEVHNLFYLPDRFDLQDSIPVHLKTLTVRAPAVYPLRYTLNGTADYSKTEEEAILVQRWQVHDIPALQDEYDMPPRKDVVPHVQLFLGSFHYDDYEVDASDWNGIARWTRNMSREKEVPADDVARKARELTAGVVDPTLKAQKIYEFVQSQITYVAIELGIGGLQPHDNGSVFKNRYGDCKDKATLLIAMLQAVGVRAYPVLIRTRDSGLTARDYPSSDFNHQIAALRNADGYLFMDPTWENAAFGELPWTDQGANALVVMDDGAGDFVQTPLSPPDHNHLRWLVTAAINDDGDLEGSYTIEARGQEKTDFAGLVANRKPSEREDALAGLMGRICPGANLLSQDVIPPRTPDDPFLITIRFKVPRYLVRSGNFEILPLHLVRFPAVARLAASPDRHQSIFFETLSSETVEVRVLLPARRHLRRLPEGLTLEGPGILATTSYESRPQGGRDLVVIKRSLTFSKREIPAADFSVFKKSLASLMEEESRAVTLQTSNPS